MTARPDQFTQILQELTAGLPSAADRLLPLVYEELRALAAHHLWRERSDHTLQPTALVHEAYLRLVEQDRVQWKGKAHFFAVAAEAIHRVLVDHARKKKAAKRGSGWNRITLSDSDAAATCGRNELDLLALDEAMNELRGLHERQFRVIELRFFAGLTEKEAAYVLSVDRSTVADDWAAAKAFLSARLSET